MYFLNSDVDLGIVAINGELISLVFLEIHGESEVVEVQNINRVIEFHQPLLWINHLFGKLFLKISSELILHRLLELVIEKFLDSVVNIIAEAAFLVGVVACPAVVKYWVLSC